MVVGLFITTSGDGPAEPWLPFVIVGLFLAPLVIGLALRLWDRRGGPGRVDREPVRVEIPVSQLLKRTAAATVLAGCAVVAALAGGSTVLVVVLFIAALLIAPTDASWSRR